ncbi:hypothetical protein GCM10007190_03300 [Macrococcus hajekii]|nr:hypothetical protein GCM10007190_03300 [Macrococcus hajekii]
MSNQKFQERINEASDDINRKSNRPAMYFEPMVVNFKVPLEHNTFLRTIWKEGTINKNFNLLDQLPLLHLKNVGKGNARKCMISVHSINAPEYFKNKENLKINSLNVSRYSFYNETNQTFLNVNLAVGYYTIKLDNLDSTPINWVRIIPSGMTKEIEMNESDLAVFNDFIFNEEENHYIPYLTLSITYFDDYDKKYTDVIHIAITSYNIDLKEGNMFVKIQLEEVDSTHIKGYNKLDRKMKYFN